jgi:hypothetical protein
MCKNSRRRRHLNNTCFLFSVCNGSSSSSGFQLTRILATGQKCSRQQQQQRLHSASAAIHGGHLCIGILVKKVGPTKTIVSRADGWTDALHHHARHIIG